MAHFPNQESGDDVLGVSVHYLSTCFVEELETAGFDVATCTIHDVEPLDTNAHSVIREKHGATYVTTNVNTQNVY